MYVVKWGIVWMAIIYTPIAQCTERGATDAGHIGIGVPVEVPFYRTLVQLAETNGSNPLCCRFESDVSYHL